MIDSLTDSPVCAASSVTIVGASLEESVSIPCRINADPPDAEFEWSFSSSGERFEVPQGHYTTVQETNAGNRMGDVIKSTSSMDTSEFQTDGEGEFQMHFLNHSNVQYSFLVLKIFE